MHYIYLNKNILFFIKNKNFTLPKCLTLTSDNFKFCKHYRYLGFQIFFIYLAKNKIYFTHELSQSKNAFTP